LDGEENPKKTEAIYAVLKEFYDNLKEAIEQACTNLTKKLSVSFNDKQYNLKVPKYVIIVTEINTCEFTGSRKIHTTVLH